MGFFKRLFGKQKQADTGEEMAIYFANSDEEYMQEAFNKARESFGYFWRELYWERRRIVPGLNFACVKIYFAQMIDGKEVGEFMWVNDVGFDGENVSGTLVNEPAELTNVKNGDHISAPLGRLADWMFAANGKTYGGFSVQVMRSKMGEEELKEHDEAWGLDFGDFNEILVAYEQKEHPQNLVEHPMSVNMKEQAVQYISQNPQIVTDADENGFTQLHREALAGNLSIVEILLENGADKNARTKSGKTALDLAKDMGWEHIVKVLS